MAYSTMRLLWRGRESVEMVRGALDAGAGIIEVDIPNDYHHTLFTRLCGPQEQTLRFEQIDLSAGPELLVELAAVRGLEELAELVEPVASAHARLRLLSPSPKLVIQTADD